MPVLCPGHPQLPSQRGIITYRLSANRLNPLAGTAHAAVFNTFRRCAGQVWYVVPPFVVAYLTMKWAEERNDMLNSKAGRALYGDEGEGG
ncbi:uncharacterized protein HMPREF1541_03499 [Cyphellophora europaea CBS 101466]|uniref:Cytochrome b-c1 complex subunit 8 n=1 Tax=Cyphellophora europaea (strain CBS 101466) TaxID=1220924 RepID=W2S0J7_CYPE1|nr:uncharacterized protein HMPREF1541_03499 [Cyphellophora europaea CBS 101466]ETN41563.1 hypothetical protein HMPREF1541_03499 [Cyphellophora europaea CBS 101466]